MLKRAIPTCPDCGSWLNAGRICVDCGVVPCLVDLDAQQAIEQQPGAARFTRPAVPNPSKRFRSDGKCLMHTL